jgi:hypothetical protein
VLKRAGHLLLFTALAPLTGAAQNAPGTAQTGTQSATQSVPQSAPPVRVNILNVCNPLADEQKEMAAGLVRVPRKPVFAADFEVARGRSSAPGSALSSWVRVRREFPAESPFSSVQYAFSVDEKGMVETLVFRLRDAADLVQIALEDKVSSGEPAAVLAADTPASRIRV